MTLVRNGTVVLAKRELVDWLARRVEERAPTAVVRFGDGERSLLEANPDDVESMRIATTKLAQQTGLQLSSGEVLELGRAIREAYDRADVLGILFGHELVEERMNRLTSLYAERVAAGREPAALANCLLNHDVFDALPAILAGRRVSAISCRDVKPVLEADWQLADVATYQVPSQHSARDVDGAYEAALHDVPIWPDAHDRVLSEIAVRERGEVFLVGAGVSGKDLCIRIRDMGGVALDLGSALDRMVGKITRGPRRRVLLLHAQGKSVPEIADHLRDRYGVEPDVRKIRELTEDPSPSSVSHPHEAGTLRYMGDGSADLDERRARIDSELAEARGEERRLARRLEDLGRQRLARTALVGTLQDDIARAAASRSFRYGHGLVRGLALLTFGRHGQRTALDAAGDVLRDLQAPPDESLRALW
jgi:hypothetical protein